MNKASTKEEHKNEVNRPLFTGDYRRDTSVSEFEKAADASQAIYNFIKSKKKKANKDKR